MADIWKPEIETMSREQLRELQGERLRDQVAYVHERSEFYRRKFAGRARAGRRPERRRHPQAALHRQGRAAALPGRHAPLRRPRLRSAGADRLAAEHQRHDRHTPAPAPDLGGHRDLDRAQRPCLHGGRDRRRRRLPEHPHLQLDLRRHGPALGRAASRRHRRQRRHGQHRKADVGDEVHGHDRVPRDSQLPDPPRQPVRRKRRDRPAQGPLDHRRRRGRDGRGRSEAAAAHPVPDMRTLPT